MGAVTSFDHRPGRADFVLTSFQYFVRRGVILDVYKVSKVAEGVAEVAEVLCDSHHGVERCEVSLEVIS
jgi:hypothetical protein